MAFALDGKFLTSDYDEEADILYLWVDEPRRAITYETSEGHHVQLDPETREFVGVAILDFKSRWEDRTITLEIPVVEQRVLELV
jgi:uncharacterized protein YuzE